MNMNCRCGVPLLMDYAEGVLNAVARRALERHVEGCSRCRGFVRSYLETPRILRQSTSARMPRRAAQALRQRVATLPARRARRPSDRGR